MPSPYIYLFWSSLFPSPLSTCRSCMQKVTAATRMQFLAFLHVSPQDRNPSCFHFKPKTHDVWIPTFSTPGKSITFQLLSQLSDLKQGLFADTSCAVTACSPRPVRSEKDWWVTVRCVGQVVKQGTTLTGLLLKVKPVWVQRVKFWNRNPLKAGSNKL